MDALLLLAVQLTVRIVFGLAQLILWASVVVGRGLGWLLVVAWRSWQRRRLHRRWR